jgi:hypothetical protein
MNMHADSNEVYLSSVMSLDLRSCVVMLRHM